MLNAQRRFKKICFITTGRADFGHLRWLMRSVAEHENYNLQLIVTGYHNNIEFGSTLSDIVSSGFKIDCEIPLDMTNDTSLDLINDSAKCLKECGFHLNNLKPDIVVTLGDRYELLPIVYSAFLLGIPNAHFSGGDITKGAIDDSIRNAISMLSTYHFPATNRAKNRLIRYGIKEHAVQIVGEPILENYINLERKNREELADCYGLDIEKKWVLLTYHSETRSPISLCIRTMNNIFSALEKFEDLQVICTFSNPDLGGNQLNQLLKQKSCQIPAKYKLQRSLGQDNFISIIHQCHFMIGNSSSGIVESPFVGIPAINIGNRQSGRVIRPNVYQSKGTYTNILTMIEKIIHLKDHGGLVSDYYYGTGDTSRKFISFLDGVNIIE